MQTFSSAHPAFQTTFDLRCRRRSTMCPATFWLAAVLFALPAGRLDAQTTPLTPSDLKVTGVQPWPCGTSTIALGGGIEITVENLDDYLTQHPDVHPSDFILYLESRPLPGLDVRRVSVAGDDKDKLLFDLRSIVSSDNVLSNEANWNKILGSPSLGLRKKKVAVTTGLTNQPLASTQSICLVVVPKMWGAVGIVCVAIVTAGLVALGLYSNVLRDPPAGTAPDGTAPRQPYSLSRVQLAIWFWAIFTCYVFIWVMNGETATLNGQVLGILGISSATLAGSALMDARKPAGTQNAGGAGPGPGQPANAPPAQPAAPAQAPAAGVNPAAHIGGGPPPAPAAAPGPQPGGNVVAQPGAVPIATIPFLIDILSDNQGISLPRFQSFAWTLVMVVIFLSTVWQTLVMPEFNGYLLSLMGLSSGTYVTMKANER